MGLVIGTFQEFIHKSVYSELGINSDAPINYGVYTVLEKYKVFGKTKFRYDFKVLIDRFTSEKFVLLERFLAEKGTLSY